MFQALLATISASTFMLTSRFALSHHFASFRRFLVVTSLISVALLLIGTPHFLSIPLDTLTWQHLLAFLGLITAAFFSDALLYHGLEHTRIEKVEPLYLTTWMFAILFAIILYPDERNIFHAILALLVALTVIVTHLKKGSIKIDRFGWLILLSAVFGGAGTSILKFLLATYNPFTVYFVLISALAVLYLLIYGRNLNLTRGMSGAVILASALSVFKWIFMYWAIAIVGIVVTTLFMNLAPLIEEAGARAVLKEQLHIRYVLGTVIIVICISLALII